MTNLNASISQIFGGSDDKNYATNKDIIALNKISHSVNEMKTID